jgi:hypothetical protein
MAMDIEEIRRRAQEIWEAEGKPEGQQDRHWIQAEQELSGNGGLPQTSSPAHHAATEIPEAGGQTGSDAVSADKGKPGRFKPGELASENK